MSDNIDPDLIKKRLVIFLRIPSETWTDVLAMLPRRILVRNISLACYRLKEIGDKNVNNVHVIARPYMFAVSLHMKDPEAIRQLAHLAANKCPLAGQFRVAGFGFRVLCGESKEVLRHCSDMFRECQIKLNSKIWNNANSAALAEQSLSILEANKPSKIDVTAFGEKSDQFDSFWQHPTVLNCPRIQFKLHSRQLSRAYANVIFQWLLHNKQMPMPTGVDVVVDGTEERPVRCLIIRDDKYEYERIQAINWLLAQCIQNFQQSQHPTDRHRFMLTISDLTSPEIAELDKFGRHENQKTGEVLLLEPDGMQVYRLRRCLAEEVANGEEFYAKTFDRGHFCGDFAAIIDAPLVEIQSR